MRLDSQISLKSIPQKLSGWIRPWFDSWCSRYFITLLITTKHDLLSFCGMFKAGPGRHLASLRHWSRIAYMQGYHRSTVEQKIRTAEENLIILLKKKTIVSVCTTNVRSHLCRFIFRNQLLQQCLNLDFVLGIVTENVFFPCLFLESIKC